VSVSVFHILNKNVLTGIQYKNCNMNRAQIISSVIFITTFYHCTILTSANLHTSNVFNDLPKYVIPMHYNLNLSVVTHIEEKTLNNKYRGFIYYGHCSITINILHPTQNIKLHGQNLNNQDLTLIQHNTYQPDTLSVTGNNVVNLYFLDILSPGIYTLKIEEFNLITDDTENFVRNSHIEDNKNTM